MEKQYESIMRDAQYRKGMSIAFFNATNAAIELWKIQREYVGGKDAEPEAVQAFIRNWRNWFLDEHGEFYAKNIASVGGTAYNAMETILRVRASKSRKELEKTYREMSEDERRDPEIRKVVDELNANFKAHENAQGGATEPGVAAAS